jgi:hypothetical protein
MRTFLVLAFLVATVTCLIAAGPVWESKPASQWTEEDAGQVLAHSPWAKAATAVITRRLTEEQLREAGQMGQPRGIGYDGVDPKGSGPNVSPNILTGRGGDDRSPRSLPQSITLQLRWESALPIQLAELKLHEIEPPTLPGDGYKVAVCGIPGSGFKGTPEQLGQPLKSLAALKRDGKRDVRPVRVEVFQRENDACVVYLFPLSTEISKQDGRIRFEAQIGRIVLAQDFDLSEMGFLGKLAL